MRARGHSITTKLKSTLNNNNGEYCVINCEKKNEKKNRKQIKMDWSHVCERHAKELLLCDVV